MNLTIVKRKSKIPMLKFWEKVTKQLDSKHDKDNNKLFYSALSLLARTRLL